MDHRNAASAKMSQRFDHSENIGVERLAIRGDFAGKITVVNRIDITVFGMAGTKRTIDLHGNEQADELSGLHCQLGRAADRQSHAGLLFPA
jgi:hypothetical protein